MPMHYLPGAVLRSKDHRSPKSPRGDVLACAYLGLAPLYLHYVGKLRCYVLRYGLEASGITISERRCATLRSCSNLLSPACGRGKRVIEGYIFSMGEEPHARFGVSFGELALR